MERTFIIILSVITVSFCADINLVWVYEKNHDVSVQSITAALDFVTRNSSAGINIVKKEIVDLARTQPAMTGLEKVCSSLAGLLNAGTPPDILIDSTRAGDSSEALKSLTKSLGLPTVSFSFGDTGYTFDWNTLSPMQEKYLIQIRPPADVITKVVRNLILSQNISNAAILYDDSFVMDYQFMSLLMNVPTRHLIQLIGDIETQLTHFMEIGLNNMFIFGSTDTISSVMKVASAKNLFGPKHAWYALTKDTKKEFSCVCSDVQVIFMHPSEPKDKYLIQMLRSSFGVTAGPDIDVAFYFDATITTLKAISAMKASGSWPKDLAYTKCDDFSGAAAIERQNLDLRQALKSVGMSSSSFGPLIINKNGESYTQFTVEIQKLTYKQSSLTQNEVLGTWNTNPETNLVMAPEKSLAGFSAITFYKVVTVVKPPFVYKTVDKNGKAVYTGYCIDMLKDLAALLKFDYEIFEPPDRQYGTLNEKLEWNGLIKEIVDGRADFGIGAISVMAERESVVDFTVPFYDMVGIIILMKLPYVPTSLFKFLSVLDDTVWGCIVAAYFFTSFLLWIFDRFSPYSYQNNMEKYKDDEEKRYFDLKECLWFCMTSLTPQGGGEAPKNISGRLLAATWWLFGFIIIASYTANLAAFLTVSRLETAVTSLDDLSKQYKIKYSPMNNSEAMVYFKRRAFIEDKFYQIWKNMSLDDSMDDYQRAQLAVWDYPIDDTYTKMWQTMMEAGMPDSLEAAIERIRNPPDQAEYAFLGDASDLRYQVLMNCDLQVVGDEFSRKPYAIPVQQGSPLKDQITDGILQLQNARQLETYKERWWSENPLAKKCDQGSGDDSGGGISIYNIGGVFIVILIGIGLAFITLIFEYWYYKDKDLSGRSNSTSKHIDVQQAKNSFGRDNPGFMANESPTAYRRPLGQRVMNQMQPSRW